MSKRAVSKPVSRFIKRLVERDDETNTEHVLTFTMRGFIVRLNYPDGCKPSDVRSSFFRFCKRNGLTIGTTIIDKDLPTERELPGCEFALGAFSRKTGERIPGTDVVASAYIVMSPEKDGGMLPSLLQQWFISSAESVMNGRVGVVASGDGAEKIRASQSAFGKRDTIPLAMDSKDCQEKRGALPNDETGVNWDDMGTMHQN